jgi:hypothetical protein
MLLLQWRVVVDGSSGVRRLCEHRLVNLYARDDKHALSLAKARGRASQFHYRNSDGNPVHFEFVGVLDLLHLGFFSCRDRWSGADSLCPLIHD